MDKKITYTFTLNSDQAHEALKAIELLMRLKINQPEEISRAVMPDNYFKNGIVNTEMFDDWLKRRDNANRLMKAAFEEIFPTFKSVVKGSEWYRLYNLYQVIRFAIHEEENPESTGVDSYEPLQFTDEPLPVWERREKKCIE